MSCPHCNYEGLQEGSRYCPNCGGALPRAPQVGVRQDVGTVQEGAKVVGMEIGNWITHVLSPSEEQAQARRQRERWDMLGRVESDWIQGLLEPSLQGQALIALGMEDRAEAVDAKGAWEDVVQMPGEARQPLAQGDTIVDAFERSKHSLLILGGPGNEMIANLIYNRVIGTLDWPFGSAISVLLIALLGILVFTYNKYLGISQIFKSLGGRTD